MRSEIGRSERGWGFKVGDMAVEASTHIGKTGLIFVEVKKERVRAAPVERSR